MGLKLVVASTPKTGNTWLRYLLKEVHRLPARDLPFPFAEPAMAGERWIAQQHWFPSPEVLSWGEREGVVWLTTVRHPGDTLLSLYHYVRAYADDPRWAGDPPGEMRLDADGPGAHVVQYVRSDFHHYLELSLAWAKSGRSIVVRYEDLCRDAESVLRRVVHEIAERAPGAGEPLDRVAGAVASCEIGQLREGLRLDPKFFRKGGSGSWAEELPPEVLEAFRARPPYPELFGELGYSADPATAERLTAQESRASVPNPFAGLARFDDGTTVSPFLVRLYLSLDEGTRRALKPLAPREDAASFRAWLTSPAAEDPVPSAVPAVSNLAAAIHAVRPDLQTVFPDPFGADRVGFVEWFRNNACRDHGIDEGFVTGGR